MQRSFYRTLARRLSAAALVIALVLGGAVYLYEMERIDDAVVDLAMREARAFAALDDGAPLEGRLQAFLAAREHGPDGHFVFAEVYDAGRAPLAEVSRGDVAAVEAAFDRTAHPFPADGRAHYDKVTLDGRLYLRVLTDLPSGRSGGFFEGIFAVAPERLAHIRDSVLGTVAIVAAVVAGTTLFLLPIVIGLNRHLVSLSARLLRANVEILEVLGGAIAKRDSDTSQHNFRVTLYAVRLAEELGLDRAAIRALIKGAFLHDVGKIAIGDAILLKPGKLTEEEFAVMKTHVEHGVDIVRHSRWLDDAAPVVGGHHEKFDGSGYPRGLSGEAIPMGARIFAVVDVFDALTSRRPYKEPMPFAKAMAIIGGDSGRHFDPAVVAAFTRIAGDLHARLSAGDDDELRAAVLAATTAYF